MKKCQAPRAKVTEQAITSPKNKASATGFGPRRNNRPRGSSCASCHVPSDQLASDPIPRSGCNQVVKIRNVKPIMITLASMTATAAGTCFNCNNCIRSPLGSSDMSDMSTLFNRCAPHHAFRDHPLI